MLLLVDLERTGADDLVPSVMACGLIISSPVSSVLTALYNSHCISYNLLEDLGKYRVTENGSNNS